MNPNPPSFLSDLANVLYDTPPRMEREAEEVSVVKRLEAIFKKATSQQIFRNAPFIDAHLLPLLSGRNWLAVAKLIELSAPAAIENMPRLHRHRDHLRRSHELAQVLSSRSLSKMIEALRADKKVD